jgi:hypothetical protein
MTSKLDALAARLRTAVAAKPFGWVNHTLQGGLDIVLSHNGEKWRLALRREKVFPSDVEADILTRAFAVAEGTEPQRRQFCEAHPSTQRRIEWRSIEYNWREVETESPGATTV